MAMKMSPTTVTPRIIGVSVLARRRSSMSSFVMIALEEVPVIPAITSASRAPHPTMSPKTKPAPILISTQEPPEIRRVLALPKNSSWSNSSPRLNSSSTSPKTAISSISPAGKLSGNHCVCGLARTPTTM